MPEVEANGLRFHVQHLTGGEATGEPRPQVVMLHGLVIDNLSSWYYTLANPLAVISPRSRSTEVDRMYSVRR